MRTQDQILIEKAYRAIYEDSPFGIAGEGGTQRSITKNELVDLIKQYEQERPGTTFVSFTQVTPERTNKAEGYPRFVLSGLKEGRTYFAKVTQIGGQLGFDYGGSENRAREKQGMTPDFTPQASIYTKEEGSKAIERLGDQLYLYYRPLRLSKTFPPVIVKANNDNPSSSADFTVVDREEVNQFKGPPRPSQRLVTVRKVSMDGIAAIKINHQDYVISDLDPIRKAIYDASGAPQPGEVVEGGAPAEEAPE